jgi:very-short-patch-repair endonuclease
MTGEVRHPRRERDLETLATRQHGVISHAQLLKLGFDEQWIERRLWERRLTAVHRNVYAVGHRRLTNRAPWWAALLAYGPGAVLSHQSAAVLWGVRRKRRGPIHVTASIGRQGLRRRKGIWIHRCNLTEADKTTRDGFPATTLARTLFDLAEVAPFDQLKGAAEEADRLRLFRLPELEQCCERGHGRRALRPVRRLITDLRPPDDGRSPLEIRFMEFIRTHDLPKPFQNAEVLGHEVDALWPDAKLIVELDSWEFHSHRAAFERDRARDPKLLIAGYRTIRVTHCRLDREPEQLAAEIRQLLGA